MKIGLQVASLRQPIKKGLATAARLGAAAVEIDVRHDLKPAEMTQTGLRQFRKLLDDYGLRVSAVRFPTRRGFDEADDLDRRVAATQSAMRLARQVGTSVVVIRAGSAAHDTESPAWQMLSETMRALAAFGDRVGAWPTLATGHECGVELARLIDAVPEGPLGVHLDPASLVLCGASVLETVEQVGSSIVHVQVNDAVPDGADGRPVRVAIGRGMVDYPELLASLEETGYRGWFSIAGSGSDDPVTEMGQAVEYLTRIVET